MVSGFLISMAANKTPLEYVIFRNADTGLFGYRLRYVGNATFHFTVEMCQTFAEALRLADGWNERHLRLASAVGPLRRFNLAHRKLLILWRGGFGVTFIKGRIVEAVGPSFPRLVRVSCSWLTSFVCPPFG